MELLRRFFFSSFYDIECLIVVKKLKTIVQDYIKA